MSKPSIIRLKHHQQEHSAACLAACVVMVLEHHHVQVTESEVRRIIRTKPYSGAHPVNLLHLRDLGFDAWPFEGTASDLQHRIHNGIPVIAFLWTGVLRHWKEKVGVDYLHAVVVVGWTETTVWIYDPMLSSGPIEITRAEFKDAWQYSRHMMAVITPLVSSE